jgi:hypothetical protein
MYESAYGIVWGWFRELYILLMAGTYSRLVDMAGGWMPPCVAGGLKGLLFDLYVYRLLKHDHNILFLLVALPVTGTTKALFLHHDNGKSQMA